MRKHISFAIAATIAVLAMFLWVNASVVETNAELARHKPYIAIGVLGPVY
jgi:hypothetical protein